MKNLLEGHIHRSLENIRYSPGNIDSYAQVQGCFRAQEIPEKALRSHLQLTFMLKQEMMAQVELSTAWLSVEGMPQHTYRATAKTRKICWFQAFKKFCPIIS